MHIEAISNGLGGPSMFMLVMAAEGQINATVSITADTGAEFDCLWSTGERTAAQEYFEAIVRPYANTNGIDAAFVRAVDKNGTPLPGLIEKMRMVNGPAGVPMYGTRGGQVMQACTGKYKIRAIRQELRRRGAKTARTALGLTLREVHRMKLSDVQWHQHYWPLVDARLYRATIQEGLETRGIPYLVSTECDMCPHKDGPRWSRTSEATIEMVAALEAGTPGLYFTDQRIALRRAIGNMSAQPSLFDSCDSGYCFT